MKYNEYCHNLKFNSTPNRYISKELKVIFYI